MHLVGSLYNISSLHFTSLHFTSLHFTSLHFTSLHFNPHFSLPCTFGRFVTTRKSEGFLSPSLFVTYNYFPNPLSKNMAVIETETIHFSVYGSAVEWGNLKMMFGLNLLITALTYKICKLTLRSDSQLNSDAISQSCGHRVDPNIKFMSKFQSTVLWLSLPHCLIVVCALAENTRFIVKWYSFGIH